MCPARLERQERSFEATPIGVRAARQWTRACLSGHDGDVVAGAELIVTELGANVVRHTTDATFAVDVAAGAGSTICIAVRDGLDTDLRVTAAEGDAESGRGLAIVEALSERWGVERTDGGKRVWVELRAGG